ncbi:recombinase family protein [Agathobaculum hominis]|nr:recombinase family protein [Agathobaculum hominis]
MEPRSFYYSCTPEADRETQFESFRSMGAHESEIFIDVCGHRKSSRSSLAMLKRIGLREGDRLTIPTLYCLSDLKKGLADELNWLRQHGIQLRIADIPMTMRCSDETEQRLASEMLYQVIDATVLKEREEKRQKQSEGIRAAQEKGVHIGRKPKERGTEFETLKQQWQRGEISLREAGRRLGVTHQTFKKWVEEPEED